MAYIRTSNSLTAVCDLSQLLGALHAVRFLCNLNRIDIELQFEKAYSLYRLNKTQEALNILNAIEEPTQHEKELKAQVVGLVFLVSSLSGLYMLLVKVFSRSIV